MTKTTILIIASVLYVLIALASAVPIAIGYSFSAEGRRGAPLPLQELLFLYGLVSFPIVLLAAVALAWILRAANVEWFLGALALPLASFVFVLFAVVFAAR